MDFMTQTPLSFGFRRPKGQSTGLAAQQFGNGPALPSSILVSTAHVHLRQVCTPLLLALGCFTPLWVSFNHAHSL